MYFSFRIRLISAIFSTSVAVSVFFIILAVYDATVGEVNRLAPPGEKNIMEVSLFPSGLIDDLRKISRHKVDGLNLFSPPFFTSIDSTDFTATPLQISLDDIDNIRNFSSVKTLAWQWMFYDPLFVSGNSFTIFGVPQQYFNLAGLRLSEGQAPSAKECKNCLILGDGARRILFSDAPAVGRQIASQIAWQESFVVSGVLEPSPYKLADLNEFFDKKIYLILPENGLSPITGTSARGGDIATIWVEPQYGQEEQAIADISSWFNEKYTDSVYVQFTSRQDYALVFSGINLQQFFLRRFFWAISVILAIAIINIGSTAFQIISQQRFSIGVRRSIGASTFALAWEFSRQVTVYALGGAFLGLVFAVPVLALFGDKFQFCGVYDCLPVPVRPRLLTISAAIGLSLSIWWLCVLLSINLFTRQSPSALLREDSPTTRGVRVKNLLARSGFASGIVALLIVLGLRDGTQAQLDRILGWTGGERAGAFVSWMTRYNQPGGNPQFLKLEHYRLLKEKYPDIQVGWLSIKGLTPTEFLSASASMSELRPPAMLAGRWFTPEEEEHKALVAVLGTRLGRQIANARGILPEELVGQQLHIYTIIGVMDEWPAFYVMGYYDDIAYILPGVTLSDEHDPNPSGQIVFIIPEHLNFQATIDSMMQTLLGLQTKTGQTPQYILPTSEIEEILAWRMRLYGMLGIFAAFSLFIGAVGVMNQVFAWVVSRWREIGIRRALGATRVDVARMVLAQALQLTLLAALTGGAAGTFIALLVQFYSGWPLTVYPYWLAVTLGVAALAALLFGGLPAWWAASRAPTEMLRME